MLTLRYYFSGKANDQISKLLTDIKARHQITSDLLDLSTNGKYDSQKEKTAYESDFKPRAKVLKNRMGAPITISLRSRKARNYYVSTPGTIAISSTAGVEWYTLGIDDIVGFLEEVLSRGYSVLEERSR